VILSPTCLSAGEAHNLGARHALAVGRGLPRRWILAGSPLAVAVTGSHGGSGARLTGLLPGRRFAGMTAPELGIKAIQRLQFGKAASLHHTALLQHYALISLAY